MIVMGFINEIGVEAMRTFRSALGIGGRPKGSVALPEAGWLERPDGVAELHLDAVRISMMALCLVIITSVLLAGASCALWLAVLKVQNGRWLIVILAGTVGIIVSLVFLLFVRLSRRVWRVCFGISEVTVTSGRSSWTAQLTDLRLVRLRERTDYARIVLAGAKSRISLFPNLGLSPSRRVARKAIPTQIAGNEVKYLPAFPAAVIERLAAAGLVMSESSKNSELSSWLRPKS